MQDGKLNILQVHNFYCQPGGEDTVVANEKRLLEEAGHAVFTYYRSNAEMDGKRGLRRLLIPFTSVFSLRTYRDVKALIREKRIDIVHVHNTHVMVSPSVFYACFSAGVPVVQTLHNFRLACPAGVFFRDGQICEECLKRGLSCALRHRCYRGSRAQTFVNAAVSWVHRRLGTYRRVYVICLTKFNRDKLLMLGKKGKQVLNRKKIFIKPNFSFESAECETGAAQADAPLLFVGRLEELKGPLLAVRAMEQLPNQKLLVIGDGLLRESLEEYTTSHHMDNVTFLGWISKTELEGFYEKAKAVISCSQCYESFPMVLTEAYAHGVPVIAGDHGNMRELVIEGSTGFHFTYDNPDSLADALRALESADLLQLRRNARLFYEQRLSAEKNLEILEEIYRRMLKPDNCR